MLTSYNYFLENMKVADRRKILLQVCGDADFNEVIESQGDLLRELPEMLRKPGKAENYYTVDEYRAIAAKEKNLTDKELDDIPQRIDEAEKAKPDVTGLDAQTIDNTMAEIKEKRRELESQRAARESGATTTKEPTSGSATSAIWQVPLKRISCTPSRTSASMKTKSSA